MREIMIMLACVLSKKGGSDIFMRQLQQLNDFCEKWVRNQPETLKRRDQR